MVTKIVTFFNGGILMILIFLVITFFIMLFIFCSCKLASKCDDEM